MLSNCASYALYVWQVDIIHLSQIQGVWFDYQAYLLLRYSCYKEKIWIPQFTCEAMWIEGASIWNFYKLCSSPQPYFTQIIMIPSSVFIPDRIACDIFPCIIMENFINFSLFWFYVMANIFSTIHNPQYTDVNNK